MIDAKLIPDLDENDYFAGPELSASGAKVLLRSPAKYRWEREHPTEQTRAMVLGSCFHTSVLGTGKPFVVIDGDGRTKAVKDARAEAAAAGHTVLTGDEGRQIERMTDAVQAHPLAAAILSEGAPEQSIYWTDEATGVRCRGRMDWNRANAIVDLKSTIDASPEGFGKQAANLLYDLQSAWYITGFEAVTGQPLPFLFIAVEKDEPHLVAVHQLPDEALDRGRRLMRDALELFARCTETGTWPAYGDDILTPTWPRWAA